MGDIYLVRSGRFAWERVHYLDGFLLADPFDEFLRRIGEDYLDEVWRALANVLGANGVDAGTLTWGASHPAYTATTPQLDGDTPLGYFGWALPPVERKPPALWVGSYQLSLLGEAIARDLDQAGVPVAIAGADIRSHACRRVFDGVALAPVAPDDVTAGLELVIDQCTEEVTDWAPGVEGARFDDEVCGPVARAILRQDGSALFDALERARRICSPHGYRILVSGFADYLLGWLRDDMPDLERRSAIPTPPIVVPIAGDLTMTIRSDQARRPGWLHIRLGERDAPVHCDSLLDFVSGLQDVAAGRAASASLVALGRVWQLVVSRNEVSVVAEQGATHATPPTTPGRLYAALRPHRSIWLH